jgi:hypothetical protein
MPWSGGAFSRTNGVHTGATLWVQDRDAGTKILATRHDTHDQDLADGINATLEKSGSNAATGNLDIGSNRITLVADGTAKTDAATVNQIQSNAPAFQATDTGTANAYVIALSPAITAYAAGQAITFKAGAASTTASTLNVNTLGTKALKKKNDQDIASGDIEASQIVTAVYDGTSFQVTSQLGSEASAGGSNTQIQYNSSGSLAGSAHLTFDGTSATVANPFILPDGAVGAPALTNTGDLNTGVYFPAADQLGVVVGGSEKIRFGSTPFTGQNLLINGSMTISQRGAITAQGGTDAVYTACDRWVNQANGSPQGRYTSTQDTTSTGEFGYQLKIDCTTAEAAVAAGESICVVQSIEAQNLQHLRYGNAAAKTTVLTFTVTSPKSGTHCVALVGRDGSRSYVREFTVASADTAETLSVTFPGDASGTINNDTGVGLDLVFPLVCGSNFQVAADAWASGIDFATSNQQNLLDDTSNNLLITGIQLEVGEVATAFEHRSAGEELTRCKRYFEYWDFDGSNDDTITCNLCITTTAYAVVVLEYVEKRATPTFTFTAAGTFDISTQNTDKNVISIGSPVAMGNRSTHAEAFDINLATVVAGDAGRFKRDATDTCNITIDAEL